MLCNIAWTQCSVKNIHYYYLLSLKWRQKIGKVSSEVNKPAENKGTCWLLSLTKNDFSWYMFT